jgi:hypothetical protein
MTANANRAELAKGVFAFPACKQQSQVRARLQRMFRRTLGSTAYVDWAGAGAAAGLAAC